MNSKPAPPAALVQMALGIGPAPVGRSPDHVRIWFDAVAAAAVPEPDGRLATSREAAETYARRPQAGNTRRAYRSGVRAWCDWCEVHALPCLPASVADVVAFLAAEHGRGVSVNTLDLRRAAIRYLHVITGQPVPTAEARGSETMAGVHREAAAKGQAPAQKRAATIDILRQILAPVGDDLVGLRDRALLLTGFAGALRRAELAAIRAEHIEAQDRGLRLTLPHSKGARTGRAVTVAIPYGATALCPVRALYRWQEAAAITEGPVFRRIWVPPSRALKPEARRPSLVIGTAAIDGGTVGRIIKSRARAAGFDDTVLGGQSLTRGAMTAGMDRGLHPTRLRQLGRHKTRAFLDTDLEFGDPFEGHPLSDVM
jgi:site-specific recombinase XerD